MREIQAGLDRSKYRDRFRLEQRWAVTTKDIRRALLDCQPQIVHFSGHSVGAGEPENTSESSRDISFASEATPELEGLLLEDETGHSKLVSTDAIAHAILLIGGAIALVRHAIALIKHSTLSIGRAIALIEHMILLISGAILSISSATALINHSTLLIGSAIDLISSAIAPTQRPTLLSTKRTKAIRRAIHLLNSYQKPFIPKMSDLPRLYV